MSRSPCVLFVALSNDPGSDRIVAAMGHLGAQCGIVGSSGAFAAQSRFANAFFPMPRLGRYWGQALFLGPLLNEIMANWQPDFVIPLDELSAHVLRDSQLYIKADPGVRSLIERSLGAPAGFEVVCSRQRLVEMAHRLGVRTARQEPVVDLSGAKSTAAAFGYPVVLKREQTCGGTGVIIAHSTDCLAREFRRAWLRAKAKQFARWTPGSRMSEQTPLSLQRFIPGSLAFRVVACADGIVLDGVSFIAECRNPPETGASTVIRQIEVPEMDEATKTIVAALGCSGFVALDFILTPDTKSYLIEMNARPVACGHLGRLYGHDIYAAVLNHLCDARATPPIGTDPPPKIALFPRELDRDPESPILEPAADTFHDIPWDDPGLVNAYAAWLEQRHPAQRAHLRRRFQIDRSRTTPRPWELSTSE